MNNVTDSAGLDEEFDRLEQELDALTSSISQKDNDVKEKNPQSAQPPQRRAPPRTSERIVAAAQPAATVSPLPVWQKSLLERDLQEQNAAAALRTEARAVTEREEQSHSTTGGERATNANGTLEAVSNAPSQGKWVWNGTRWEWKTTEPATAELSSSLVGNRQSQIGANHDMHVSPALIGPVGPVVQQSGASRTGQSGKRPVKRMAAGEVWVDETLNEWPENDFRIFVGDLAPDAAEHELVDAFGKYKSFNMARIVKDKHSGKCRGYGFVSFASGEDMVLALREMNGKYVGSRPVKLKRSNWQKRNLTGKRRKDLKLFRTIAKPAK